MPTPSARYDSAPDIAAYNQAFSRGELDHLKGQYVAYHNGELRATANSDLVLAHKIIDLGIAGKCVMVHVGASSLGLTGLL